MLRCKRCRLHKPHLNWDDVCHACIAHENLMKMALSEQQKTNRLLNQILDNQKLSNP